MQRKGLTAGSGRKGYYNVIGKDPSVHRMSAKGIKQPQRLGTMVEGHGKAHRPLIITHKPLAIQHGKKVVFGGKCNYKPVCPSFHVLTKRDKEIIGNKVATSGLTGIKALEYAEKLAHDKLKSQHKGGKDMPVVEIDENYLPDVKADEGFLSSVGKSIGKAASATGDWVKKEIPVVQKAMGDAVKSYKESQTTDKAKSLANSKYGGLSTKYIAQKNRVDELKSQIANREDSGQDTSKLLSELETEEKQYRELQEEVTDVQLQAFSNDELRELAIRDTHDSILSISNENQYEKELIRRVAKRKELAIKIKKAEQSPVEKGGGLFEGIFDISDSKPKRTMSKPMRRVKSEEERQEEAEAKSLFNTFGEE